MLIRGDTKVIESTKSLKEELTKPVDALLKVLNTTTQSTLLLSRSNLYLIGSCIPGRGDAMGEAVNSFRSLYLAVDSFRTALYNQKHAFYFRKVKSWETCIRVRYRPH